MNIKEFLTDNILLFDGGMGTLCAERVPSSIGTPCELLNLSHPAEIARIHEDYIEAGSRAIKTNTFGANRLSMDAETAKRVMEAGFDIANKYCDRAFVFADIGPITVNDSQSAFEEFRFAVDTFIALGARHFLFETNAVGDGLAEIAVYIKANVPDAFVLVSFASLPDGFTRAGKVARVLLTEMAACEAIDAIGLNCASGAGHMAELASTLGTLPKPLSLMPNAGYPTVLGNRTFYDGDPHYFARRLAHMATAGARILGGCCGTTPAHIKQASLALSSPHIHEPISYRSPVKKQIAHDRFWDALCDSDARPIAVELDPPANADIEAFMSGAKALSAHGASVITIADCPIGRARMDASLLACKLHRELGIGVLPHMTCRDRNLNATKALLLGLCAEDIHNVLAVTGDPIPSVDKDEVKSVYNFNSRMLASYITALGESELPTPFRVFGALNVNARNFAVQLRLAKEKEQNGVCGFLTQPILTPAAFENLKLARKTLTCKILGGIFPLVSHRNACFMNSEVSGVSVDERIIALYEGKDREEGEAIAARVSLEIAKGIRPYVDGYYLITPFSRTALVAQIMDEIHDLT